MYIDAAVDVWNQAEKRVMSHLLSQASSESNLNWLTIFRLSRGPAGDRTR